MKFSIITVAKNNKSGLVTAIECVRRQTYRPIEHIIIDGGSTDGTVEILRQDQNNSRRSVILNEMKDLNPNLDSLPTAQNDIPSTTNYQLITVSEPDSGIYDAINKGINLATGEVIGLLHSDDLYADNSVIEKYASIFNQPTTNHKPLTIEAVYSDLVYVKEKSNVKEPVPDQFRDQKSSERQQTTNYQLLTSNYFIVRNWKTHKSVINHQSSANNNTAHHLLVTDNLLKKGWMPPHPTLFIRKEIFKKFGLYRTDMKIAADYEMTLRLLFKHKITTSYLPLTTYYMRLGGASNKNFVNIIQKSKEDLRAMKLNGISFPAFTLFFKNITKLPQFLVRGF